jgi:hypothetical protein
MPVRGLRVPRDTSLHQSTPESDQQALIWIKPGWLSLQEGKAQTTTYDRHRRHH